ncbi:MAG: pilin glycosylation ligase domain-containing protein, partial [Burkholderiales bacterium]|nr:pilin glycosylation ligase domain-containing protein [Burkholderiales bacterium]
MMLHAIAAIFLGASWLMPLHFLPWISWHNEMLTFAAVQFGLLTPLFCRRGEYSAKLHLPKAGWFLLLLCAVIALQAVLGSITFLGDAIILLCYLALCLASLIIGYEIGQSSAAGGGSGIRSPIEYFAIVVLAGAICSVVVALVQAFEVWGWADWIVQMRYRTRPGGNLAQPNQLATLVLFGIASLLYLFEIRRMSAITAVPLAAMLLLGVAATESRTGALSLLVMAVWWVVKRPTIGFDLTRRAMGLWDIFFLVCFWFWPSALNVIQEGHANLAGAKRVNTDVGMRQVVWPQLWHSVMLRPWFGWGLGNVSGAHNAVLGEDPTTEPYT